MNNPNLWLAAYLSSLYILYSQLIMTFSKNLHEKSSIESIVIVMLLLTIAILIARQNAVGIKISIVFPLLILFLIIFGHISPGIFKEMDTTYGLPATIIFLGIPILPSIVLGIIMLKNKNELSDTDQKNEEKFSGKRSLFKNIVSVLYLLALGFNFWISSYIQMDFMPYVINFYVVSIYSLLIYFGIFLFKGNEMARRISIAFPLTLLFIIGLLIIGSIVNLVSGDPMRGILIYTYLLIFGIGFVILLLLSLPFYKKKKKISE